MDNIYDEVLASAFMSICAGMDMNETEAKNFIDTVRDLSLELNELR